MGFGTPSQLRERRTRDRIIIATSNAPTDDIVNRLALVEGVASVERVDGGLRIQFTPSGRTPALVHWLSAHGVDIEQVRPDRATFEDAFLDLVDAPGAGARA